MLAVPCAAQRGGLGWSLDAVEISGAGDSLAVALTWSFNDWNVAAARAVVFSPVLRNGDRVATLTPVSVYGRKAAGSYPKVIASGDRDETPVLDLSGPARLRTVDIVPRSEWMDTVRLILTVSEWSRRDGLVLRSTSQRGVFARPPEPAAPVFPWEPLEPVEAGVAFRDLSFSAPVRFAEGSSRFDPDFEGNREALEPLLSKVSAFSSSGRYNVRGSSLVLTVPPAGVSRETVRLSRARVASVYSWMTRQGVLGRRVPSRVGGGEDWDGVRSWVAGSPYRDNTRLAEILSWEGTGDAKAGAIRREMPDVWADLNARCFPGLGRLVYNVSFRALDFTVPDSVRPVYEEVPEALGPRDFWLLSTAYVKGSGDWLEVIRAGAELCPYDAALNLDAAWGLIDAGRPDEAAVFLRAADGDPRAPYAFAAWLYAKGRYDESLERLGSLEGLTAAQEEALSALSAWLGWSRGDVPWERCLP